MGYQAYPEYKDSGVEWLAPVPSHWSVERLRFSIRTNPTKSEIKHLSENLPVSFVPMEAVGELGGLCLDTEKEISEVSNGYSYFADGDVLIAKITPCFENGKGAIAKDLINGIGFGTTELHVLRSEKSLNRSYLFYLSISHPFRDIGASQMLGAGGQKRITDEFIRDFRMGLPSLFEQGAIASLLDHKTTQIDRLIEKKQELIEKLQEQRTTIIAQAVTKGLDENVLMKAAHGTWFAETPRHWEVRPLKFCLEFLNQRRIPLSAEERTYMGGNFPYYGASGIIDHIDSYIFSEPTILIAEDGANLLSRSTPLAFEARGKYWVNNHAHILKPIDGSYTYWANLLCTIDFSPWITGAAQPKLTKDNLGAIPVPCPPILEQEQIANYINSRLNRTDPMIDANRKAIDSLQEYRTALITAAVTGQIDVRDWQAPASVKNAELDMEVA